MARYIDAEKADVESISCFYGSECRIEDVQEWLDEQPTADVVEVKHGEWIKKPFISGLLKRAVKNEFVFTCSVCGFDSICVSDYCRNCGADMRERRDGND